MASGRIQLSRPEPGGLVLIGERVKISKHVKLFLDSPAARIEIGSYSGINRRSEICAKTTVHIGEACAVGWDVCITDTDYHEFGGAARSEPVHIGDHVWIGSRALILKGVTIGSGAVIGAGTVVAKDVPPGALFAGPPGAVIREGVTWRI